MNSIFCTALVNRIVGNRPGKLLIAIGIINKESDGRRVISVTFQGAFNRSAIGREREKCGDMFV